MASLYKKPVFRKDPKTGERVKGKSKKWWAQYRDELEILRRKPLSVDKAAAQAMLQSIVKEVEHRKAGILDPIGEAMQVPIQTHLSDFRRHLEAKNNSDVHIRKTVSRIEKILASCGWKFLREVEAGSLERFLVELRRSGRSLETSNHYLRAVQHWMRWLVRSERLARNPLERIRVVNSRVDRRHERRALSPEELHLLIETAMTGPRIEGLMGPDRAMLYLLAAWTGLRRGELGSLTKRSFRLDADPPVVTVAAAYSKRRREDRVLLHTQVVERLRPWLDRQPEGERLFPITAHGNVAHGRKTSKMIRLDLEAARRKWLADGEHENPSDFLAYRDVSGKVADFHSLRHTFITNLARSGASPKVAQTLARHSDIRLTLDTYTHVGQDEQLAAIEKLTRVGR